MGKKALNEEYEEWKGEILAKKGIPVRKKRKPRKKGIFDKLKDLLR